MSKLTEKFRLKFLQAEVKKIHMENELWTKLMMLFFTITTLCLSKHSHVKIHWQTKL